MNGLFRFDKLICQGVLEGFVERLQKRCAFTRTGYRKRLVFRFPDAVFAVVFRCLPFFLLEPKLHVWFAGAVIGGDLGSGGYVGLGNEAYLLERIVQLELGVGLV